MRGVAKRKTFKIRQKVKPLRVISLFLTAKSSRANDLSDENQHTIQTSTRFKDGLLPRSRRSIPHAEAGVVEVPYPQQAK